VRAITLCLIFSMLLGCGQKKKEDLAQETIIRGFATYFDRMGTPSGACGVSDVTTESQDYVALNVQDTPKDYTTFLARPIKDMTKVGLYANGLNCGRWIRVTLGRNCVGDTMDGRPYRGFCQKGQLRETPYTGATLDMIVADSCQDGNSFCRDDRGHLDLHTSSLANFRLYGKKIDPQSLGWNNPEVIWKFIEAPNYEGDIKIFFVENASPMWPTIVVTHLRNGIGKVESLVKGTWVPAKRQGDMGQVFNLPAEADLPYKVRVYDIEGNPINDRRKYSFNFPCRGRCPTATEATIL